MALESAIKDGLVSDWDKLEKIWDHALSVYVKADLKETPVLLAEKPYNPTALRRKYVIVLLKFEC